MSHITLTLQVFSKVAIVMEVSIPHLTIHSISFLSFLTLDSLLPLFLQS